MDGLAAEEDWPDAYETSDFISLLARKPIPRALRAWVEASPRRALSPDGHLFIARPRAWRGPGTYLTNARPEPGDTPLWSIDTISADAATRKALPLGVTIHALELSPQPFAYRLALEITPALASALGLEETRFTLETSSSALARIPEPWPPERVPEMLPGLAVALRASGIDNASLRALEAESTRLREEAAANVIAETKARAAARKKAKLEKASAKSATAKKPISKKPISKKPISKKPTLKPAKPRQ